LSGADISFIAREAAYNCMRRNVDTRDLIVNDTNIDYSKLVISEDDFAMAVLSIKDDREISNAIL
jgi:hypothetical protein